MTSSSAPGPPRVLSVCVMQCDAVWCSVMQCDAVWCSVLQCVVCCSVLQCVAVCYSVLQCVSVCCTFFQCVAEHHPPRVLFVCPEEQPRTNASAHPAHPPTLTHPQIHPPTSNHPHPPWYRLTWPTHHTHPPTHLHLHECTRVHGLELWTTEVFIFFWYMCRTDTHRHRPILQQTQTHRDTYGVATISRLLKITGLFCIISSLL